MNTNKLTTAIRGAQLRLRPISERNFFCQQVLKQYKDSRKTGVRLQEFSDRAYIGKQPMFAPILGTFGEVLGWKKTEPGVPFVRYA